jgi:hypothetical protein
MRFNYLHCIRNSIRWNSTLLFIIFDIASIIIAATLYAVNKLFLCSLHIVFFNWYFNDILAGIFFLAYTNLLLFFVKRRIQKFLPCVFYIFFFGIACEYIFPPLLHINATDDIFDIIAYLIGSIIYASSVKILLHITKNDS